MAKDPRYAFSRVRTRYRFSRWLECMLFGLAGALLVIAACVVSHSGVVVSAITTSVSFVMILAGTAMGRDLFRSPERTLIRLINTAFPSMEESTDLLLSSEGTLTGLQRMQKSKVSARFLDLYSSIHFRTRLRWAVLAVVPGAAALFLAVRVTASGVRATATQRGIVPTTLAIPAVRKQVITIIPPAYTGRPVQTSGDFNLFVPANSRVKWQLQFTDSVTRVACVLSGKDSIWLSKSDLHTWSFENEIAKSGFYQIVWTDVSRHFLNSEFFRIEVIPDLAPVVTVETPAPVQELTWKAEMKVRVRAVLSDDYGIRAAVIVATVAKGSGESIKFREEKISFLLPELKGRRVTAESSLNLNEMGMTPGDELYFYIEATDNKTPDSQRTRTETFFITVQDTAQQTGVLASEMGIDIMPAYFRSQRQIIIDSEKLLEEQKKKTVDPRSFKNRSNDLGADEHALRLRYGQFMGEEQESEGIGHSGEEGKQESIVQQFGHTHDTQNEQNQVAEKTTAKKNDAQPAAEFVHGHDTGEEATFLEQSIKAKLKAALTLMWDAELHLRLADPAKSLPYQYKILKLLKEISNDSRMYVRRTGFDPPPVKEEKRLTGDPGDIQNSTSILSPSDNTPFPLTQQALPVIESLLASTTLLLSDDQRNILQRAGNELARAILEHPEISVKNLTHLHALIQGKLTSAEIHDNLLDIRRAFWKILPAGEYSPVRIESTPDVLEKSFLKNLEEIRR